jgi:hypothetical protein
LAIGLVLSDEIVKLREYRAANPDAGPPQFNDSGFRALVEENVKNSVWGISQDTIIYDVSSSPYPLSSSILLGPRNFLASFSAPIDDPDPAR